MGLPSGSQYQYFVNDDIAGIKERLPSRSRI
jgi:hypothetical protein